VSAVSHVKFVHSLNISNVYVVVKSDALLEQIPEQKISRLSLLRIRVNHVEFLVVPSIEAWIIVSGAEIFHAILIKDSFTMTVS
jgi:hypothetical protein